MVNIVKPPKTSLKPLFGTKNSTSVYTHYFYSYQGGENRLPTSRARYLHTLLQLRASRNRMFKKL
jgi:hypothetical protein